MSKKKIRNPLSQIINIDDIVVRGSSYDKYVLWDISCSMLNRRNVIWSVLHSPYGGIRICLKQSK